MVKLYIGLSGSGKTKEMLHDVAEALEQEHGSVVCIEKGGKLRYDVNYKVRLIEYSDYQLEGVASLKAFISGLHAGNFDITHIFLRSIHRLLGTDEPAVMASFCAWCETFGAANGVNFTLTARIDPTLIPAELKKYL
jgi:hypothetical protein